MSKVRNAPGYEAKYSRRLRMVRWPTRGGHEASTIGFHRPDVLVYRKTAPAAPKRAEGGRVVQGAMVATFKPS